MTASLLLGALTLTPYTQTDAPAWDRWPPTDVLVEALASRVEGILASQDPTTGRFGAEPWICNDQNVIFPLAAAWAVEHPQNSWYHDARVLAAIGKGGEALVADQDAKGMWTFRKKDNSTWGQIHMPWTYSRWIRAYDLVGEALPQATREKWERGLLLGFEGIRRYADGGVHNIPTHHAMALYIAGKCFGNAEWQQAATAFMSRVVEHQNSAGYWSEHFGPVVGYNEVYVDALGVYYHESQDPVVLEALQRSARFHSAILWPDGSSVSCIDERQAYHAGRDLGNVGFSHTPEGRGFLIGQLGAYVNAGRLPDADYAASMLLYSGEGEAIAPPASGDTGRVVLGDNEAVIERNAPWQWCLSAYACAPIQNRWIQDRQNLVDVYLDGVGLVIGGGNTKLQPYWSTFTVGDPSLLQHQPGDEAPNFLPEIDLRWTPDQARVDLSEGQPPALVATYGDVECRVQGSRQKSGMLDLDYSASPAEGVEAHIPFLYRGPKLKTAAGKTYWLGEEPLLIAGGDLGDAFVYAGLQVRVPAGASLRWPARQHNPYAKDGRSPLSNAKLVLCLPAQAATGEPVVLARHEPPAFEGQAFEARDLPFRSDTGTRTKRLDDLGSQFLGAEKPGDSITFTLPPVKAGEYELLGEFILANSYGIVRVLLDGQAVGQPFDAYCPDVDREGERVSFGTVKLSEGTHEVTIEIVGKREQATGHFTSVKRWLLGPAP